MAVVSDPRPMLEYAFHVPAEPVEDVAFSVAWVLALGYVAACVFGLVLMGVVMAMRV